MQIPCATLMHTMSGTPIHHLCKCDWWRPSLMHMALEVNTRLLCFRAHQECIGCASGVHWVCIRSTGGGGGKKLGAQSKAEKVHLLPGLRSTVSSVWAQYRRPTDVMTEETSTASSSFHAPHAEHVEAPFAHAQKWRRTGDLVQGGG
eukprot:CAMPEP_0174707120 /NCGR_PEP_ID=MMETSP1094-20130205/9727_1 /TAXON_ID=156173 /ORGANISM="Chrysochromulina brevifilum, Strain UTEX LB 985" /LENGTH=146 /DNA_ID=CAMNT_0015905459 /DNA_START=57 /DNA_END=497 /DNA_ORIENTATION=-